MNKTEDNELGDEELSDEEIRALSEGLSIYCGSLKVEFFSNPKEGSSHITY